VNVLVLRWGSRRTETLLDSGVVNRLDCTAARLVDPMEASYESPS